MRTGENKYSIDLLGGSIDEKAVFSLHHEDDLCLLRCELRGVTISAKRGDFFTALCAIRHELEMEGLIPLCYGSSLNVYPSAMSRDMSDGEVGYKLTLGKPSSMSDTVNIFDCGDDITPSSVAHQAEFFDNWKSSICANNQPDKLS